MTHCRPKQSALSQISQLIEEMNKTIELEKEKFGNLHKIDVDNREVQYKRNLENQKRQYEDTHDTLKKQLE